MSADGNEIAERLQDVHAKLNKAEAELKEAKDACAAAKANLEGVLSPQSSRVWTRGNQSVNVWQPLLAAALFVTGLVSLYCDVHCLAALTILAINAYLVLLMVEMAVRQSVQRYWFIDFAHRFFFIFIFFFLLAGLVLSFGRLYDDSKSVYRTADNPPRETLATPTDALYFSTVTITTVGYGDFAPRGNAEWLVIWELGSGAMLLLIVLPVLASRLALLGEGH